MLKLIFSEDGIGFEAVGISIDRTAERIHTSPLPDIFENIPEEEYELLSPLAAKAFLCEERKKMIYLEKDKYENATIDVWNAYFTSDEPDGYFKGAHMDLGFILPIAEKAELGAWKASRLDKVKRYILSLID